MIGNYHAWCGTGEKSEAAMPETYLSSFGQIPDFDKKLATMRKYKISCTIILQNLKQLEEMYDKKAEPLIGNCDTILFLGSSEASTLEYVSKKLGTTTVKVKNYSKSRGTTGSSSESENSTKRELMTPDEVGLMPTKDCILFLRGEKPFYGPKFKYEKHPNYKYTADADGKLKYDLQKEFDEIMSGGKQVEQEQETMANTRPLAQVSTASGNTEEKKKPFVQLFDKNNIHSIRNFFIKEKEKSVYDILKEAEEKELKSQDESVQPEQKEQKPESQNPAANTVSEPLKAPEIPNIIIPVSASTPSPIETPADTMPIASVEEEADEFEDVKNDDFAFEETIPEAEKTEIPDIPTEKPVVSMEVYEEDLEEFPVENSSGKETDAPFMPFSEAMNSSIKETGFSEPDFFATDSLIEDTESSMKAPVNNAPIVSTKEMEEIKDAFSDEDETSINWEFSSSDE